MPDRIVAALSSDRVDETCVKCNKLILGCRIPGLTGARRRGLLRSVDLGGRGKKFPPLRKERGPTEAPPIIRGRCSDNRGSSILRLRGAVHETARFHQCDWSCGVINFAANEELLLTGALLMAACYGAGALSSLLAWWSGRLALAVGHLAALAGAMAGLGVSVGILLGDPGRTLTQPLPVLFPFARLSLSVDGLSAYFLLVISLVAVAAAMYGPAYLRAHSPDAGPARIHPD